jgi:hypothetical protein
MPKLSTIDADCPSHCSGDTKFWSQSDVVRRNSKLINDPSDICDLSRRHYIRDYDSPRVLNEDTTHTATKAKVFVAVLDCALNEKFSKQRESVSASCALDRDARSVFAYSNCTDFQSRQSTPESARASKCTYKHRRDDA